MNYDTYYNKVGDAYVIHFPNYRGLSLEELTKIFSAYGSLLSIQPRHGKFGLCFVRYQNLEDARKCIHALQNNKEIKILQHKHKISGNSKNKNVTNKMQRYFSRKNAENTEQPDCGSSVETDSDHNSHIKALSSLRQILQLKQTNKVKNSSSICSDISDYSTRTTENSFTDNEIPSLIYRNVKKIVQTQEVIVANLHPTLGIQEIIALFNDHVPICISNIKQVPETDIRYCHIYFSTADEAVMIEKKFDKYLLCDRVLIVLRLQMLLEEAYLT